MIQFVRETVSGVTIKFLIDINKISITQDTKLKFEILKVILCIDRNFSINSSLKRQSFDAMKVFHLRSAIQSPQI